MRIIYIDGSELECATIEIFERHLYADDMYIIPIDDVDHIED